jgi:hypothetical protein
MKNPLAAALLLLATIMATSGCGGTSPSAPSEVAKPQAILAFLGDGSFSATVDSATTIAAMGGHTLPLSPGVHEVSGTYSGRIFSIGFSGIGGGVQTGTIQNVAGPTPDISSCQIIWGDFSTWRSNVAFKVRFTVTNDKYLTCQGV